MAHCRPTVAIVGAGPAGASAAHVIASHGFPVVMLERARLPRDKVCGEGCTPRAVRNLERMGLLSSLESEAAEVTHAFMVSPGGVELLTQLPPSIHGGRALVIPRTTLDMRLVERAVRAGASLREGVHVEGIDFRASGARIRCRGGEVVRADLVIGCDGIPSVVRRSVGAPPFAPCQVAYAMRAIFDNVRLEHATALALIWNRDVLPAYGWVFPLPNGRANVGIGIRMDQMRARGVTLSTLYERFLELPRVRTLLRGARPTTRAMGHGLPMTTRPGAFVYERALLAGDAAGFVNPLTGEGIEYALESGDLAGRVAVQAAQLGDFSAKMLAPYAWACADQFERVLDLNGWLRCAFSVPWLVDRLFRAGHRSSLLREDLARITLGGEGAKLTGRMVLAALAG